MVQIENNTLNLGTVDAVQLTAASGTGNSLVFASSERVRDKVPRSGVGGGVAHAER